MRPMTHSFRRAFIIATALLGLARIADAQNTATLSGSIVDASGALLPGVQIMLRQRTTGFTRSTITAADGRFVFAGISAGPYELRAELSVNPNYAVAHDNLARVLAALGRAQEAEREQATAAKLRGDGEGGGR